MAEAIVITAFAEEAVKAFAEEAVKAFEEEAVKSLKDLTSRKLGYIRNCTTNFNILKEELKRLEGGRDMVQHSVDEATRNGKNIEGQVENWFVRVNAVIDEVRKVISDYEQAEMKCLKSHCPNVIKRFQHGKKAFSKLEDISKLYKESREFNCKHVGYTSPPQELWFPSIKPHEELESRTSVLKDVMDALNHPDVTMVGIHGMGGVGKTTLARGVGKNAEDNNLFDSVVFVEVSHPLDDKKKIHEIQDAIAGKLGKKFDDNSPLGRARELVQRLKKEKRVLLILDNIWESLELDKVGIPLNHDHTGCKLLLTSRDLNVLERMNCRKNFHIGTLDDDENWNLFKKIAGSCIGRPDLGSLPRDVAKKCSGLPVAIVTTAGALKDKERHVWEDALVRLDTNILSCIEFSYEQLEPELMRTFLLCCKISLIGEKASLDNLLRYGLSLKSFDRCQTMEVQRNHVLTLIHKLNGSSLLLQPSEDGKFSIHDVVLECGREIAGKQNSLFVNNTLLPFQRNLLENLTSIFLVDMAELPNTFNCPNLTFFYLKTKDRISMPSDYFQRMPRLKVVHLEGMDLLELPTSLISLEELGALYLKSCYLRNISSIENIETLEILALFDAQYGNMVLPAGIGKLKWLRVLDLRKSSFIVPPGIISKLIRLEELYVGDCYDLWPPKELNIESVTAFLHELKELCCLTAFHIRVAEPDTEILLKSIDFQKLQRCELNAGGRIVYSYLRETGSFYLANNPSIECIVESMIPPTPGIKTLHLQDLVSLEKIYHDQIRTKSFCQLRSIKLQGCHRLKNLLPLSIVKNLSLLEEIEVFDCDNIEQVFIVDRIENGEEGSVSLEQIRSLTLRRLPRLNKICSRTEAASTSNASSSKIVMEEDEPLFQEKVVFPNLKDLILEGLNFCKSIWPNQLSCWVQNLTRMSIFNCNHLKCVFPSSASSSFQHLKYLEINGCKALEELVPMDEKSSTCVEFPSLQSLDIRETPSFKTFIFHDKAFSYLEKIKLDESQLRSISPSSFNHFPRLKYLEVSSLHSSRRLHIVLGKFHILEELEVTNCREIFSSTEVGKQAGGFAVLKKVPLLSSFKNLKILKVYSCFGMIKLMTASTAKSFVVLEEMIIETCFNVKQIIKSEEDVEDEITFYRLKRLELRRLPNLLSFYDGKCTFNFPWLEKLVVVECLKLMLFYSGTFSMPNFQQLEHGEKAFADKTIHKCKNHEINRLIGSNLISSLLNQSSTSWSQLKLIQKHFPEHIKDLLNLEQLNLDENDIEMCQNQFSEFIFSELRCFCISNDDSITFPNKIFGRFKYGDKFERFELSHCSYEEIFSYEEVGNALFPLQIKFLRLYGLRDLKGIWGRDYKQDLLQNFESLDVVYCHSLNSLLLPPLSFGNLKIIKVHWCTGLVSLMVASTARSLEQLEELKISSCWKMRQVVTDEGADEKITFRKLKNLELNGLSSLTSFVEGNWHLEFPVLDKLSIESCPSMNNFTLGSLRTPRLRELSQDNKKYPCKDNDVGEIIKQYHEAMIFSRKELAFKSIKCMLQTKEVFYNLRDLSFRGDEMLLLQSQLPQLQQVFPYLQCFQVFEDESTSPFPLSILHTFQTVVQLELHSCSYEEIFSSEDLDTYAVSFARIKKLSVYGFQNLKQLWEHDSILQSNIEELIVKSCGSLVTLLPPSSSFQNLTWLRVEDCDTLVNLFKPTTAQFLVKLSTLEIKNCKMMETVLSSPEEVVRDGEIIFHKLEFLELYNLSSLTSFCSQNYTLAFPSLNWFILKRCPRRTHFSPGILDTPKLFNVWHGSTPLDCYNNLNTILLQIHDKENLGSSSHLKGVYVDSDPRKSFSQ